MKGYLRLSKDESEKINSKNKKDRMNEWINEWKSSVIW